jgi:hypothetical protein
MLSKLKDVPRSESAAMVATGAAFFMIVLDTSIVNLALPRIKDVFHADLTACSGSSTAMRWFLPACFERGGAWRSLRRQARVLSRFANFLYRIDRVQSGSRYVNLAVRSGNTEDRRCHTAAELARRLESQGARSGTQKDRGVGMVQCRRFGHCRGAIVSEVCLFSISPGGASFL